jgi:hypothetical protein
MKSQFSQIIEIPSKIYKLDKDYINDSDINKINDNVSLKKYISKYSNIKRGDVIHFGNVGNYRNEGKCLYDGTNFVSLDYTLDPYGAVPSMFKIEEFSNPLYFSKSISHNYFVNIDGINYKIISKKKILKKSFVYHVKHNYLPNTFC